MFPLLLFDISLSLPAETHRAPRGATHANIRNLLMQSEKYAARYRVGGEIMHFSFHRV